MNSKRSYTRFGTAARALCLSAAPPEAAGNHVVSVYVRVSAEHARCLDVTDDQSARAQFRPLPTAVWSSLSPIK
ncbi:hypothetical protein Y032_0324g2535 [Ancylostoma ceylanicum]|uniref:Uncharacterized protein n=1 Tax=Ancylostoma ceylanicum TaxID=53326 RepID=A0A016S0A8_9BILA|nr:hypothetical protein Y032_0324g2535 [Ancylostoma ceylanicum]